MFKSLKVVRLLQERNIFEHASLFSFAQENPKLKSKVPATENDIVWENLLKQSKTTAIWQLLTMVGLILISFFLMTPATVMSLLNLVQSKDKLIANFWAGLISFI